ncbi:MAG TPA: hypothetical protein VNS46_21105 [Nocardioides sp.]|nr:hypothetical protein [Nocardioides sp.]
MTVVGGSVVAVVPPTAPVFADADPGAAGVALDLPAGVSVTGTAGDSQSRAVVDTTSNPDVAFDGFPSKGTSYLVLSSGRASQVFGTPGAQLSTDFGDDTVADSSSVSLTVAAGTAGAGCLFLDFALGTEETLGYTAGTPDDELNIVHNGVDHAINAGDGYFTQDIPETTKQPDWPEDPTTTYYQVNQLKYWHKPGDRSDPEPGTAETPSLPAVTGLNNVTTRDTARIPIDVGSGSDAVITVTVRDAPGAANGDLDSVGFLDNVRLRPSCESGTGVEPVQPDNKEPGISCCGIIRGIRGVGNALAYDPVPSTPEIERHDSAANGWRSPSGTPVELRFRWYRTTQSYRYYGDMRQWTAIPNADRQTYVPTALDRSRVLIVLVTGVVDGRRYETYPSTSTSSTWYVTTTIQNGTFVEGAAPTISGPGDGDAEVGETLTAQVGDTVPRQDSWEWQWYAKSPGTSGDGSPISGATGQTFVIGEAQAGKVLMVKATAKRDQFDPKTWPSAPYGPIQMQTWQDTPQPTIVHDGTPAFGETLSVSTGAWGPVPTTHSYQWKRGGSVIAGATSPTYKLVTADVGASITVDVSGVLTGYPQLPQTSPAVVPGGAALPAGTASVTGTPKVGVRLTAAVSGWPTSTSYTYAWYAGTTLLQSGTSRYYTPTGATAGKQITLAVTGSKAGYEPETVASAPTAVVAKGSLTVGSVRITGTFRVGYTVRAYTAGWGPAPVVYRYRWRIGSTYVTGTAGTRSYLKLPTWARGKRVTLVVTVSKTGYTSLTRSAVSSVVG